MSEAVSKMDFVSDESAPWLGWTDGITDAGSPS